jgi:YHS domain-containing protein/thiol-disulfide isomerase/thioredoxin
MRYRWSRKIVVFAALLATLSSAVRMVHAQQESVHWHSDLESAKTMARESGRLVLVHFWTPSCGPCLALNQNVFNQPGVSAALEARYVMVKLNADENSATAQLYGINRVPTDVVVTPDGQTVGKLISPPTPAAYVAEVTALATKFSNRSGQAYAAAAAAAPMQPQINAAYAGLNVSPSVPLAVAPPLVDPSRDRFSLAATSMGSPVIGTGHQLTSATPNPASQTVATQPAWNANPGMNSTPPVAPQLVANPAPSKPAAVASQPPITPIGQSNVAPPPAQVNNPYLAATTSAPPAQHSPIPSIQSAVPSVPIGSIEPSAQLGALYGAVAPPAASAPSGATLTNAPPDPSKLPPGTPPLGFEGYCPVSMRNQWKWVAGNPQWGIVHRGRTYWFAGPVEQKQFWTDPDRYTPALSGMDPVMAVDHQQQVPGKREHSLDYDGLFYMFASEATLQQFTANPARYASGVRQAMGIPRGRLVR